MKKSYLYFVVPLILTAIFAVFYVRYASVYEEKIAIAQKKIRDERDAKLKEEARQRESAIKEAVAATEKRKKEKAEREAREQRERDEREAAVQLRRKAQEESRKFADQVKRLQKEITEAKEVVAKIETNKKSLQEEEAFLREYVKKAEANTQSLTAQIEKIDLAEKARIEAERAAAAAKK